MRTQKPKRLLKKLRALAKNNKYDLRFQDECHLQQHGTRCRMWIPPEEKDPIIKLAPTRKSIALFGCVSASTGQMVTTTASIFNAVTFLIFLKKLLKTRQRGKKLLVVLDNARYHHAIMLKSWLCENKKIIKLVFLPPYSPDLNNVERVWKLTRRLCTHNKYFESLDALTETVMKQMKFWKRSNETLRKLCCVN